jgi:7-cyano-7-deazaguanine reductase
MSPARELPPTGPLPRPESPEEAREVLRREAFPAPDVQRVTLEAVEFTSICPRTKSLKYYLWSYRDEGAFCETLAGRIAEDVMFAIEPRFVQVQVSQNVRGGIAIVAVAERGGG